MRRRSWLLVAAGVALVALLVGGGLFAYRAVFASGDRLADKVPGDAAAYVAVFIDPPLAQKAALLKLAANFPRGAVASERDRQVNDSLDRALGNVGLSFSADVKPWLGAQVSIEARVGATSASAPPVAFLLESRDDVKAAAAMNKMRSHRSALAWGKSTHDGVELWKGIPDAGASPSAGGAPTGAAYAVLRGMVVVGSDPAAVEAVIDTAHGHRPSLADNPTYRDTIRALPSDRLLTGYLDAPALVQAYGDQLDRLGGGLFSIPLEQRRQLGTIGTVAFALAVREDALLLAVSGRLDPRKTETPAMTPEPDGHQNAVLAWTPADAYGVATGTGLRQLLQSLSGVIGLLGPEQRKLVEQLRLSDPAGPAAHLGPDYGLEIGPGAGGTPAGAVMFQAGDPNATGTLLDQLAHLAGGGGAPPTPIPVRPGTPPLPGPRPPAARTEVYRGATISYYPGGLLQPAFAVPSGMGLLASTEPEVKRLIDAHAGGSTVTQAPNWKFATAHLPDLGATLVFVNLDLVVAALEATMKPADKQKFLADSAPYLRPLRAVMFSSRSGATHFSQTLVIVVRGGS